MQPDTGKGEMPSGEGSLSGMFGTRGCLTDAPQDLEHQSASCWATRLSTLRKPTLGGILPPPREPGCFNHSGCAAAGLG